MENKITALATFLEIEADDITEIYTDTLEADGGEYMVLTDQEADERLLDYVKESLWACTPSFLAEYLKCPVEAVEAIQANEKCESNNEVFINWLEEVGGSIEALAEEAGRIDGRGHFLSSYDGCEEEQGDYFICRTN